VNIRWKLRMAAAQREVWTGTQLRRLLAERAGLELSAASVSALFTKEPAQVKLSTLAALCTALDCTPSDLFEVDTTPLARPAAPDLPHPADEAGTAAAPVRAHKPVTERYEDRHAPTPVRNPGGIPANRAASSSSPQPSRHAAGFTDASEVSES
jgi:putative transcriptional regulator